MCGYIDGRRETQNTQNTQHGFTVHTVFVRDGLYNYYC